VKPTYFFVSISVFNPYHANVENMVSS